MADGDPPVIETAFPLVPGREERGLTYPFGDPPAPGEAIEVAPGVLWMRLPLPFSLNHINLYAIADDGGWTVVDAGLRTKVSMEGWEAALAGPLGGLPVRRVICTHMHPDHIGLAGWLCEKTGAPLLMSRLEYITGRMLVSDTGKPAPVEGEIFYRAAGWNEAQIARYRDSFGMFGKGVHTMPQSYHRLSEGDDIVIGGDVWRVVVGSGHSPEHVCLWRTSDDVFIAGDQILPRISSNVSVFPTEPAADPLADWLGSLDRLKALLPEGILVLPGHGEPFRGVPTRIDALIRGHQVSLTRLERALSAPRRAIDVFGSLFARPVDDDALGMATGESLAHLNHLVAQGLARCERDADGVDWWTATQMEKTT